MGFVSKDVIDDIRQRTDIVDLISSYIPLKRAGNSFKACCPFHNEKTPSFTVSPDRQFFHCFGCQKSGDVVRFVMEREGVDFPNALHVLAARCGIIIPTSSPGRDSIQESKSASLRERLYELHERLAVWYSENLRSEPSARDYLSARGMDTQWAQNFRLGWAPDSWDAAIVRAGKLGFDFDDLEAAGVAVRNERGKLYDRFRGRVMFPIWNEQGRVVAFSGRILEDRPNSPKYLNSPETDIFKKGRILYGLNLARKAIADSGRAILCEGQMDVLAMHRAGLSMAVAPQGTAFTPEQAAILGRHTHSVVVSFDADKAGLSAASRALDILLPLEFDVRIAVLPGGEDPDSLLRKSGSAALAAQYEAPMDFVEFILSGHAVRPHSRNDPKAVQDASAAVLSKIALIGNEVCRGEYVRLLSDRLGVPVKEAFAELNKARHPQRPGVRAAAPAPARPGRLSPGESDPVAALLEMALQNGEVARMIEEELPHDMIGVDPVGMALNKLIAMTLSGEWTTAREELVRILDEHPDAVLASVLASSRDRIPEFDWMKAASDCVASVKARWLKVEIEREMALRSAASDPVEKSECARRVSILQKELVAVRGGRRPTSQKI